MGELMQGSYDDTPAMLPQGESMAAYAARTGKGRDYDVALAAFRQRLAEERGMSLDELHNGQRASTSEAGQDELDTLDLDVQH